jgi:Tfp pilus assembly protein PilW
LRLNKIKKVLGFSLIELMIAMLVGIFLLGGLSILYLNSKSSDKMRSQISEMEENARTALITMRQIISHAGYPSEYSLPIDKPFYAETDDIPNPTCRTGGAESNLIKYDFIRDEKTENSVVAKRDTMVVVNMLDSPNNTSSGASSNIVEDCVGSIVEPECSSDPIDGMYSNMEAKVYNYLYINTPEGRRALTCMGSLGGAQPIAENIESLQFLYGVSKTGGVMVYRNAEDVTSNNEWGSVTTVQVGILVRSEIEVLENEEARVFLVLDEEITTPKDRRIYRAYTTTIVLPNMSISL